MPVVVIFGASSDVGRGAAAGLLRDGAALRLVTRYPERLQADPRASVVTGDLREPALVAAATVGASVVVSCAHARYTRAILAVAPPVSHLVLLGSAWRWSAIADPGALAVRDAEAAFLASSRAGVMLHPSMIYGGYQERNISRLLAVMRRTRCLPLPDGGRKSVQPVHVDDVAAAVVSAVQRPWSAAVALPLPGPTTLTWREMALQAAAAAGLRPLPLPVPVAPLIGLADLLKRFGVPIDSHTMRRFRESIVLPAEPAAAALGLTPRDFHTGIRQAVAAWAADGAAGPRRAVDRR